MIVKESILRNIIKSVVKEQNENITDDILKNFIQNNPELRNKFKKRLEDPEFAKSINDPRILDALGKKIDNLSTDDIKNFIG